MFKGIVLDGPRAVEICFSRMVQFSQRVGAGDTWCSQSLGISPVHHPDPSGAVIMKWVPPSLESGFPRFFCRKIYTIHQNYTKTYTKFITILQKHATKMPSTLPGCFPQQRCWRGASGRQHRRLPRRPPRCALGKAEGVADVDRWSTWTTVDQ